MPAEPDRVVVGVHGDGEVRALRVLGPQRTVVEEAGHEVGEDPGVAVLAALPTQARCRPNPVPEPVEPAEPAGVVGGELAACGRGCRGTGRTR